jgi:SAM-dependent methyltransferase
LGISFGQGVIAVTWDNAAVNLLSRCYMRESTAKAMPDSENVFSLSPPLPLPEGWDATSMLHFLESVRPADAPASEMAIYCREDWQRFIYTLGLTHGISGACLELGANPYFTTTLLYEFTGLQLTLANYFGPHFSAIAEQLIVYRDRFSGEHTSRTVTFHHFNIEHDRFPFEDHSFDCVLFCEIIEHLQMDPIAVIREIKRVMKPGGALIVTTPNVARLENIAKLIAGANIYDPYSGYGPYGRHNREYNRHELFLLLDYCGFDLDIMFTADVHKNHADSFVDVTRFIELVKFREEDLGQYIFVRSRNNRPAKSHRPAFLYRSYAPGELE